jgi:uncharacterized protein YdhG (YjbR/CyaY superfamily)
MKDIAPDVANYFSGFDGEALSRLRRIRELAFELLPEATEAIKYGIPTVLYKGNLFHYAAFKRHIGMYPLPSGIEAFRSELERYERGKGSVRFPLDEDLPIDLIRKLVAFRIAESDGQAPTATRRS